MIPGANLLPTTDSAASSVDTTVQDLLNDAVPIAEAAIIAAVPAMATPVWKETWEEVFKLTVQEISNALGTGAGFLVMDAQTYLQVNGAANAFSALKAAQAKGDPNEIAQARAAADSAAAALVNYNGSLTS